MFHKRLLSAFPENKRKVIGIVLCQWISLLANCLFLFQTADIIASLYQGKEVHVIPYAGVLVGVLLVRGIMNTVGERLSFEASVLVKVRLRELVYKRLTEIGSNYSSKIATANAVQISTEGVEQLEIYFGKYVPQFFYSLLAPLTLFVLVGTMSIKTAVILFLCVPLIPISIVGVQKFAKKMLNKYWGTYTELGDHFLENLQGLSTMKIYQADEYYSKKMDEEAEKFRKVTMRVLIMQLNSISIMDLVAYGGAALGIVFSVLALRDGTVNVKECFFIIMVSAEFFLPLRLLGSFFHIAMNGNAAANKIFKLLDEPIEEKGTKEMQTPAAIFFDDVTFAYPDAGEGEVALSHLNFTLRPGRLYAFVGESGCGKSTVASLIMGTYAPSKGEILVGDVKNTEIAERSRYENITRITHESYIFKGTVRENLLMGNAQATDAQMRAALEKVDLLSVIEENGGLAMTITEKGSNLSGGQRQRLAVARALLHNSAMYIFDEATSNVDVESENKIMEVVQDLAKEKTVLVISHRLANVVNAQEIFVFSGRTSQRPGHMVEQGDHETLLAKNGVYKEMYEQQMQLEKFRKEA